MLRSWATPRVMGVRGKRGARSGGDEKNGAEVVHLATGLVVGYPPCPYIDDFCEFIHSQYGLTVVIGTHPIPQKYFLTHQTLGTWNSPEWQERIKYIVEDEATRLRYD